MIYVLGADISETALRKCKEKGIDAIKLDLERDYKKISQLGTFDYVLLMEVLEHLKNPEKVIKESLKIAKEGVIITLPNIGFLRWRVQLMLGYFPRQSYTHLHFWTINDFKIFLKIVAPEAKILDFKYISLPTPLAKLSPNLFAWQQAWFIRSRR